VKQYAILVSLIIAFPVAYSQQLQDFVKTVQELTLTSDSLKKELNATKDKAAKELQASKDSSSRIDSINKVTVSALNKKISDLENEKSELNKQIKKLDRNNIKNLESSLHQKTDTIKQLREVIKNRDSLITVFQKEAPVKEQEKFKEGQQNVYSQIARTYQNVALDELIKSSTKQSVERDLPLIGNNTEVKKKLHDLQAYFAAVQVLEAKYDDQRLKVVQMPLDSITEKSVSLDELKKKLKSYKQYSDDLKATISKIMTLDKNFVANDTKLQKTKQLNILAELSSYFHNYYFNYTDYPYLSDIILEIMKLKQKDANSNISHLSSKL
jgi:hypothetical protein